MRGHRSRLVKSLAALMFLVIFGVVCEQVGRRHDHSRFPQVGRSVDIGGRTLNIYCSGNGSPTVVFDTFSHEAGYQWLAVQAAIATLTRACWYDRAGYGWSDPGPLYPTATAVATDLHALLRAANVAPPYVFVGPGDVTLQIRVYRRLYPSEVGGAVFVDGNDVIDRPTLPTYARSIAEQYVGSLAVPGAKMLCEVLPVAGRIGLIRASSVILGPRPTRSFGLTPSQQRELDLLSDNPTAFLHRSTGLCVQNESRKEAVDAGDLGDRPLVVLFSQHQMMRFGHGTSSARERDLKLAEALDEYERSTFQPRLAALSSRGRLVGVERPVDRDDVIRAVRDVVIEVQHVSRT
jgi:hypothetical protein